jgi:GT2 family glycosyltransferase
MRKEIALLLTVYNRLESTIIFLESLYLSLSVIPKSITYDIYIVDDLSTDNTVEYLKNKFPLIKIIQGSGNDYWAGGMRRGWKYIQNEDIQYNNLIVLNNDIVIFKDSLKNLLTQLENEKDVVIVGEFLESSDSTRISYGGLKKKNLSFFCSYEVVQDYKLYTFRESSFDTLNMNFAIIPIKIINQIGFLDNEYIHSKADIDFGLMVRKAGYPILASSEPIGYCQRDDNRSDVLIDNNIKTALQEFLSVKWHPLNERKYFCKKHCNINWLICFITPYLIFFLKRIKKLFF